MIMACSASCALALLHPQGMPKDGYDYSQHVRSIHAGGLFVTPKGEVVSTTTLAGAAAGLSLPTEALPSEKMVDRMLESIVISEGVGIACDGGEKMARNGTVTLWLHWVCVAVQRGCPLRCAKPWQATKERTMRTDSRSLMYGHAAAAHAGCIKGSPS